MNLCSLWFLVSCAVLVVVFHLLPRRWQRRVLFSLVNVAFLALAAPNRRSLACVALFVSATYAILLLVKARPWRTLVFASIACVLALFVVLKRYSFLEVLLPLSLWDQFGWLEVVGLSYMLFKFIHVLVDSWQGQLAPCSFFSYAGYQLAFFTLVAGPIQRYNTFREFWDEMDAGPDDSPDAFLSWSRVLTGMIKMGCAAPIFWYFFDRAQITFETNPTQLGFRELAAIFYGYPLYLYFNFSGYTDVAIGVARLLGCRLPENFNYPFLARNVIDYWNRWHISLTHWIRDYVFMTSYKAAAERFPGIARYLGYALLCFALFVSGVWHGTTEGFVVFGLLHGVAAGLNRAYGDALKGCLGTARWRRYQKNRLIHLAAVVTTFHYVCFCLLFFASGTYPTLSLLRVALAGLTLPFDLRSVSEIGWAAALPALLLLLLLWGFLRHDAVLAFVDRLGKRLTLTSGSLCSIVLLKTVFVVGLLLWLWAAAQDPVVLYGRF